MDLASRDSYIQKFASKAFSQQDQAPKKRPFGNVYSFLVFGLTALDLMYNTNVL